MNSLKLFDAYGIELEYMIVDKDTLDIKSIADELIKSRAGQYTGDFENGLVTWSNELVLHVIELKCTKPESDLDQLEESFRVNVRQINRILGQWNAMLLPTAAHPWMNPQAQTKLWPHDNHEIYHIYNEIFDCKGHGWSNLQSTHLNLPFSGSVEFGRLHAAIRVLLPILPALCASSPILDSKITGLADTRLSFYRSNQKAIPSITGMVVPEAIFTPEQYEKEIYSQIAHDIAHWNAEGILDPVWVNSRGAIPRFDRGSIEIRIMDVQECPSADMAIQSFVIHALQSLVNEQWCSWTEQKALGTEALSTILSNTITDGQHAKVEHLPWLNLFGLNASATARDVIEKIHTQLLVNDASPYARWSAGVRALLDHGTLSSRIIRSLKGNTTQDAIAAIYRELADCLHHNRMFLP